MIDSAENRENLKTWQENGRAAARKYYQETGGDVTFAEPLPNYFPLERQSYRAGWNSEMRLLWAQKSSDRLENLFGEQD